MSVEARIAEATIAGASDALCGQVVTGDAVEVLARLPDESVDHVVTDPPYGEHTHRAGRRGCTGVVEPTRPGAIRAQTNRRRDLGFAHLSDDLRDGLAAQFVRLAKRWVLVFSDHVGSHAWAVALEAAGLEHVRTAVWIKRGATPQFTGDRPAQGHECIVIAHRRKPNGRPMKKRWNGGGKHGVYDFPIVLNRGRRRVRWHTTQKPIPLMRALLNDFTDAGDVVLDPCAGAGSTLVAAEELGRRWIGVEVDPGYADVARLEVARVGVRRARAVGGVVTAIGRLGG